MRLCLLFAWIRSFPFSQYLETQMELNIAHTRSAALDCLEVEAFPYVIFQHLREVKLIDANGNMREMQLIKLLLAKSPVLVRMLINPERFFKVSPILNRLGKLTE